MAHWLSDGSAEISSSGDTVTCAKESPSGDVFNALWEDGEGGVTSGQHYWKLHTTLNAGSTLFVGVTDKAKFAQGWGIKGLLYGGNLSNGCALLVQEFGPCPKSGDKLGILVSFVNDKLKVYFDVNGNSLGLAFDLPVAIFKGVFPVVHFSGPGSVQIEKVLAVPASPTRPTTSFVGIEGDWKLVDKEFKISGAVQPLATTVTLRLTKEAAAASETYAANLTIVNHINFKLVRSGAAGWTTTPGMSTRMLGSPESMTLENQMTQLKATPSKVELDGAILVWKNDAASMDSKWERFTIVKETVTENPFQ